MRVYAPTRDLAVKIQRVEAEKRLMRRRLYPLLLSLLVLPLAGCGAGDTISLDPVAEAATNTARSSTTHMSMSASVSAPGLSAPIRMSAQGSFDNQRKRGSMTLDMSGMANSMPTTGGLNDPSLWRGEEAFDFSHGMVIYMRFPFLTQALRSDKSWVRMDLERAGREMGIDLSQFMQLGQGNPAQQLQFLRAVSGDLDKLGTERVRGVGTTRYRTTVDLRKYPKLVPKSQRETMKKSIDKLVEMMGTSSYPVEVWIDSKQLVRRMKFRMTMSLPQGETSMAMSIDFYGFGRPVTVRLPAPEETIDMTKLMEQAQAR